VYPATAALIKRTVFVKPSILKTYTVIPTFSHELLPVLKSNFLMASENAALFKALPQA
jgi:hypothetical protein